MPRQHANYNGQVSAPFTIMSSFTRESGNSFRIGFDTWKTVADFDADGNAIQMLRRDVAADAAFGTTNATLLTNLRTLMLNEMGLAGRGFSFDTFSWFPVQKVLTVTASKGTGEDKEISTFNKAGSAHDTFITANVTLFNQLNAAAWVEGKNKDQFLNVMTPAV